MQDVPCNALRTAHTTTRRNSRSRKALNAFLDARSNLCYTQINVEQDHNLSGDGCGTFHCSGGPRRAIVHPHQGAKSKGLSTKLMRQDNQLRDIAKEHSCANTAT